MRFHIGPPPSTNTQGLPPGNWTPLRHDFGPKIMLLLAIPAGGIAFLLVGWLWLHVTPMMEHITFHPIMLFAIMFAIFPIHEFLHAIAHPDFGMSRKTIVGAWPSHLLFYAHYDGPRSRERLLVGVAMPLLLMTLLPLIIGVVFCHPSTEVAFFSSLNALGVGVDILLMVILFWQVPPRANVFNQGWRTYWSARS
jgi:hypothetical protein